MFQVRAACSCAWHAPIAGLDRLNTQRNLGIHFKLHKEAEELDSRTHCPSLARRFIRQKAWSNPYHRNHAQTPTPTNQQLQDRLDGEGQIFPAGVFVRPAWTVTVRGLSTSSTGKPFWPAGGATATRPGVSTRCQLLGELMYIGTEPSGLRPQ